MCAHKVGLGKKIHFTYLSCGEVKNPPAKERDVGDMGSIPGSGRSPEEGSGNPLQCSCMINPKDRGAWRAKVQGVTKELDTTERLNNNHPAWLMSLWKGETRPQRDTRDASTKEGPCEDAARGQPSTSQGERPQETRPTDTLTVDFQNCPEIQFCCLNHPDCGLLFWQP